MYINAELCYKFSVGKTGSRQERVVKMITSLRSEYVRIYTVTELQICIHTCVHIHIKEIYGITTNRTQMSAHQSSESDGMPAEDGSKLKYTLIHTYTHLLVTYIQRR